MAGRGNRDQPRRPPAVDPARKDSPRLRAAAASPTGTDASSGDEESQVIPRKVPPKKRQSSPLPMAPPKRPPSKPCPSPELQAAEAEFGDVSISILYI